MLVLKNKFALRFLFFLFTIVISSGLFAQSFLERSHIGIGIGAMKYRGNIADPYTKFAFQGNYTYELTDHFSLRGQLFFGSIGASDASWPVGANSLYTRPHPFHSRIQEASILVEYNLLNMNQDSRWTPYVFAGVGYFHYTPYHTEYDQSTNRFYDVVYYATDKRNKLNIPFGGGIKYGLTNNIRLSLEANVRYTTTNDLDGYNVPNESKDFYYSGTLGISFRLGGDYSKKRGGKASRYNSKDCPPVY
ncbi:MAG: hypothetical protein DI598_17600 [Pseudopedobacter saltans]|uniref:DUF6089 domain-containing protein n=1 Tax=Pseudopedobacter saltans TaxID=151895 RepID=A0A2W5G8U1_9SPHI|nr:MAG: hypothetical protein DI598_17600 [Pseudopedobacter saltans]